MKLWRLIAPDDICSSNMSEREEESKLVENLPALDALPVEEVHS